MTTTEPRTRRQDTTRHHSRTAAVDAARNHPEAADAWTWTAPNGETSHYVLAGPARRDHRAAMLAAGAPEAGEPSGPDFAGVPRDRRGMLDPRDRPDDWTPSPGDPLTETADDAERLAETFRDLARHAGTVAERIRDGRPEKATDLAAAIATDAGDLAAEAAYVAAGLAADLTPPMELITLAGDALAGDVDLTHPGTARAVAAMLDLAPGTVAAVAASYGDDPSDLAAYNLAATLHAARF